MLKSNGRQLNDDILFPEGHYDTIIIFNIEVIMSKCTS